MSRSSFRSRYNSNSILRATATGMDAPAGSKSDMYSTRTGRPSCCARSTSSAHRVRENSPTPIKMLMP